MGGTRFFLHILEILLLISNYFKFAETLKMYQFGKDSLSINYQQWFGYQKGKHNIL